MTRRIFRKVLLVIVAIFGLLVLSGVLSAQGRRRGNAFDRVRKAQERHTERLMAMDGVEGTAVGVDQSGQLAVKVFTARHGVAGIGKKLDGVPVHVVVTGKIYALAKGGKSGKPPKPNAEPLGKPLLWYERPVPIGVSTGHPDITAGTIACRVTNGTNVYALSNNHIYANKNRAYIGDNVLQPGTYDGGVDPDDAIGTLAAFEPIVFRRWARNEIDAAIALSDTDRLGNATPPDGYGTPNSITAAAYVNQLVKKYGRTTGETNGVITAINATVRVGYSRGTARFVKQIIVESGTEFIGGGDSGSLLVTNDGNRNPVGLLFAGTDDGLLAVANRIDLVLNRFGVTVDDSAEGPVDNPSSVSITSPSDGDTVSGTINVTADASDDNGVTQVEFFVDGDSIGIDDSSPYSISWNTSEVSDGSHIIKATATDTAPQTASDSISVTVDNINDPPVADAGPDQTISDADNDGLETVTLDGSGSSDPDGTIDSYEWKEGETVLGTTAKITKDFTVSGSPHTVTLTVTDDKGASASDDCIITVLANQAPTADAGPDQTATVGQTVNFDGSGSSDPDGIIDSYDWDFGDGSTGTGVNVTRAYSSAGTYTVTLAVEDNGGETTQDTATVTVSETPATEEFTIPGTVPPKGESRHTVTIASPGAVSMYVRLTWNGWGDLRLRIYNPAGNKVAERDKSSWRNRVEETTIYNLEPGDWQVAAKSDSRRSSIDYTIEVVVEY